MFTDNDWYERPRIPSIGWTFIFYGSGSAFSHLFAEELSEMSGLSESASGNWQGICAYVSQLNIKLSFFVLLKK